MYHSLIRIFWLTKLKTRHQHLQCQFEWRHGLLWQIIQIEYKVVLKQSLEQRVGERVFVVLVTTLRVSFALKKSVTSRPVGQLGKLPPIEEELSESSQILFWFWRNHQMMIFMFQFQQNDIVAYFDEILQELRFT